MPTMSKKESIQVSSYSRKLRDNVKSILENYSEILKASKVSVDDTGERVTEAQVSHVENEVVVRAANIVRAAEALSKLVSDLKEILILNDFSFINEITTQRMEELQHLSVEQSKELMDLYASVGRETSEQQPATSEDATEQQVT